jgi:hypothetical protein
MNGIGLSPRETDGTQASRQFFFPTLVPTKIAPEFPLSTFGLLIKGDWPTLFPRRVIIPMPLAHDYLLTGDTVAKKSTADNAT